MQSPQQRDESDAPGAQAIVFERLWARIGAETPADPVFRMVKSRYDQVYRCTPNYADVTDKLRWVDIMGNSIEEPDVVRIAIIFHAFFDEATIAAEECARRSAGICAELLQKAAVAADFTGKVHQLILNQTAPPSAAGDVAHFGDIIRAHWGDPPKTYDVFRQRFWAKHHAKEYPGVFAGYRVPLLRQLIGQERTYGTDYFESTRGAQARSNFAAELKLLLS